MLRGLQDAEGGRRKRSTENEELHEQTSGSVAQDASYAQNQTARMAGGHASGPIGSRHPATPEAKCRRDLPPFTPSDSVLRGVQCVAEAPRFPRTARGGGVFGITPCARVRPSRGTPRSPSR